MKAGIAGVGEALPAGVITNEDWGRRLDTSDTWIVKRTGIHTRHWLGASETVADLAVAACERALADAGRDGAAVDRLILSTVTPDRPFPGVGAEVAARIGAPEVGAYDLNAACAGFVYGLDQAAALVESGRAARVVVCGAEGLSRMTDTSDRGTAVLFGDGAGAVVVEAAELEMGCPAFVLGSDGVSTELLHATREERLIRMQGREVYRHAVRRMVDATRAALARSGLGVADVDLFVAHQANARIVEAAAAELNLPAERVMLDVGRTANTSSASIPLALAQAEREGRLRPGATVALAAFGAGFSWGAGVVSWKEAVPAHA